MTYAMLTGLLTNARPSIVSRNVPITVDGVTITSMTVTKAGIDLSTAEVEVEEDTNEKDNSEENNSEEDAKQDGKAKIQAMLDKAKGKGKPKK